MKGLPRINIGRLKALLARVNSFGFNPMTGGYNRIGYTKSDMACRQDFAAAMREDGLFVTSDAVANVFGRYGGSGSHVVLDSSHPFHVNNNKENAPLTFDCATYNAFHKNAEPCIMVGSHLDTVPDGGAFDGSLGACVALECVRTMIDHGIVPKIPIEVVGTAEEEGRFGGMLGSQTMAGAVGAAFIRNAMDANHHSLQDAMSQHGLAPMDALRCARGDDAIVAFLELHIEQGPVLEASALSVGIVEGISGVSNISFRFVGCANHSGTTPMHMRADAFAGMVDFTKEIASIIDAVGTDQSRITVGKVTLEPNFPHTIPGVAECSVITRDLDEAVMRAMVDMLMHHAEEAAQKHSLSLHTTHHSWLSPVKLDAALRSTIEREAQEAGVSYTRMPSGAGHDAQTMQTRWPSAMIFVPSKQGISHSPDEKTDWEHIEKGAQIMFNTLHRLST